ncbi:molybdopterin cofactor-binding domain-containing protein [Erythrobacter sp. YT30]|uniref:molybdopterin cofactor-binding domain-containing protein n=1 Tax=Erythrobacter sp. YT30 TaxID=1735012 RepID=UPI00076CA111|nr:molybdopterin cofactor-binding domain-containing protein [Erythrobacter sp. YT30]KWV91719.1 xanthine dehydrogenase [Erythrobacter sp. YT30]
MQITRRGLFTGAAVGGGLLVAWWLMPRGQSSPLEPAQGEHVFGAWLKIAEDGVVSVAVPQLEMGQGVTTLLPQIIADELRADWRQIAVEPAPISGAYPNVPLAEKWIALIDPFGEGMSESVDAYLAGSYAKQSRFNATADGTSMAAFELPCREAAAAAREMLVEEAAERWGVDPSACEVSDGIVSHADKRFAFGELAQGAADRSPPDPAPLNPEPFSEVVLSGASGEPKYPRLDLPSKVDGSYQFAGDIRLPGMVYASIRHGPNNGSELTEFDSAQGAAVKGHIATIEGKRWLAAVADTWWSADQALKAMKPRFKTQFPVSSDDISARLRTQVDGGASFTIAETGFGKEALSRVDIARRYEVEPAPAAPLETASAAAQFVDGRLDLWMASQAPERAREAAARAIGIAAEDVALYPMPAGGSFDARLEHDHAIEIALIARELAEQTPRPVQLTWSRRDEIIRSRPRSPAFILMGAQTSQTGSGAIDAMRMRIASPAHSIEFGHRLFRNKTSWAAIRDSADVRDPLACEGAVPAYSLPSMVVEHVPTEIGLPTGRVRGNANSYTAFAMESFIDEIAHAAGREPLVFRIGMLGDDIRLAACLQRAAQLANWDGGANQSGQGLACHRIGDPVSGGRIACVATAVRGEGGVRVTRLSAAVDIGRIANLDIARQQIEGGLVFGIGIALGNAMRYRSGLPTGLEYEDLGLPKFADCPEIEVDFLPSEAGPADPGELGAVIAPPAIANALFSATGLRLRRLPLLSSGL